MTYHQIFSTKTAYTQKNKTKAGKESERENDSV